MRCAGDELGKKWGDGAEIPRGSTGKRMSALPLPGGSAFREEEWEHWEAPLPWGSQHCCKVFVPSLVFPLQRGKSSARASLTPCSKEQGTAVPPGIPAGKTWWMHFARSAGAFCRCSGLLGCFLGVGGIKKDQLIRLRGAGSLQNFIHKPPSVILQLSAFFFLLSPLTPLFPLNSLPGNPHPRSPHHNSPAALSALWPQSSASTYKKKKPFIAFSLKSSKKPVPGMGAELLRSAWSPRVQLEQRLPEISPCCRHALN